MEEFGERITTDAFGADNNRVLKLILATQETQGEAQKEQGKTLVEVRIDLATMKMDVKTLQAGQTEAKTAIQAKTVFDRQEFIAASAAGMPALREHEQDHKELWKSIEKLTSWSKAITIAASIIGTVLTTLVIVLGLLK